MTELLKLAEAAERLRVHPTTLKYLIKQGKAPPFIEVGTRKVFPADRLERWIKSNTKTVAGAD
jgi:excisionase family DNA binding protein